MFPRWHLAPLLGGLLAAGCSSSSSSYCPGLCPTESIHPTMTIKVEDGTASIASAEVVSGPCARLLIHSAGEAGVSTGYAAVQVTYNGSTSPPTPLCLVEVTSIKGDTTVVTTQPPTISTDKQPCCPTGSCCSETSAISLHPHVTYDQPVVTVSFPAPPDGGSNDEDAAQTLDNAATDGESEIDAAREIDAESIDAAEVDTAEDSLLLDGLLDDVAIDA
jgi:hypothetical protein